MSDQIQEYYSKEENCYRDLGEARKCFGSTLTTEAEYDAMEKGLGLMLLYCPEELQVAVSATMQESTMRRFYHEMRWKKLDDA